MAELNIRGVTAARDVTDKPSVSKKTPVGVKTAPCFNRNSTARSRCNNHLLTRVTPQPGVTHIIRFIYIQNAAQGDEHDNLPSTSYPRGGEEKTAEKKFERERAVLKEAKCFDTTRNRRSSGSLPHFLDLRYGRFEIRWKGNYTEPQYRQTVVDREQT